MCRKRGKSIIKLTLATNVNQYDTGSLGGLGYRVGLKQHRRATRNAGYTQEEVKPPSKNDAGQKEQKDARKLEKAAKLQPSTPSYMLRGGILQQLNHNENALLHAERWRQHSLTLQIPQEKGKERRRQSEGRHMLTANATPIPHHGQTFSAVQGWRRHVAIAAICGRHDRKTK